MIATSDAAATASPSAKRIAWRIAQYALAIAFIVFAARTIWRQWRDASAADLQVHLHWGWLALSSLVILTTYALLVEVWRRVLARSDARVSFAVAARVWFVSNLGKYVPGKVWQLTSMATMMRRENVSLGVAASSAVMVAVCNVVAGFVVVLAFGTQSLRALGEAAETAVITATAILLVALLLAPMSVKWAATVVARFTKRPVSLSAPAKAVWESTAGYFVTWLLYGIAFELFAVSVVGHSGGRWESYVATFTLSYLVGYLWLPAPGGLGPREWAMSTLFVALQLGTPAEAAVVTVASRLWLTVLEVVPGLLYLIRRPRGTSSSAVAS
ncbi:MAG TPA: lysylphosphatidylglycerol synthase domain-containing protein [Gemmatimonadaceae bacterium]|nr:lysylphosphatidylglycerol synthase domain-containing protein [Gemmatimonadaceae bacterium]